MVAPSAIFAFGIAHLPMLGWLAAAAVPILIHLWSRRRCREAPWAAMQYLLAALQKRRRRLLLEQWLLLALRTLIVVLLVLAVAGPYLGRSLLALAAGQRSHRVLVIDGSYSMGYRPTDRSRFEKAKEVAARIVAESPRGDGFSLVLMAAPPRVAVGTPAFDSGEALREIDALQIAQTSADLPATLECVEQILNAAARDYPRLTRREVVFLTDLGRVGWAAEPGSAAAAEIRRRAERLAASAELTVIDLGQTDADNLAVTGFAADSPLVTVGQTVHLRGEIKNFGRAPQTRRSVELRIDGRRVGQRHADVEPGGTAAVAFTCRFDTPGDHALELRLDADRLDVDNHRYLVVGVRECLRVLCIDGRPSSEPLGGATGYLAAALAPKGDCPNFRGHHRAAMVDENGTVPFAASKASPSDGPQVHPDVAPETALLERDLAQYDAVFLCNVAQYTPREAKVLDAYTSAGGSLFFFLGDRVLPDRYNALAAARRPGETGLLPARLGAVVDAPQFSVNPLDYRHPAAQAFRGRELAGLLSTPVAKYFKLEVPKPSQARVVLALGNGDPLVVEEPLGGGHVVLVATTADLSWAAMPIWPSFLPLVQELLGYCTAGPVRRQTVQVGQGIEGTVAGSAADAPVVITRPDGGSQQVRPQADGDYGRWSCAQTESSGIYSARLGPPGHRTQLFAVNVDTAESDLTPLDAEQLRSEVLPGVPLRCQTSWQHPRQQPAVELAGRGELHVELLCAVLGLILLETFLAWHLGHHRA